MIRDPNAAGASLELTVLARDIAEAEVAAPTLTYTGAAQRPEAGAIRVSLDGRTLTEGEDYELTVDDAVDAGSYAILVAGIGSYAGTREAAYAVEKASPVVTFDEAERFWPDTIARAFSIEPDFGGSAEYALIDADGARHVKEGLPDESGEYELTVTVEESDNINGTSSTRRLSYQAGDVIRGYAAITLAPGQRVRLPEPDAILEYVDEPAFALSSDAPGVLRVDGDGWLTAVDEGTCELVFEVPGSEAEWRCAVTVASEGTLTLPAALASIEEEAFLGVPAKRIALGDRVEAIGARAFADSPVEQVIIPGSVNEIDATAFDGSDPLILCAEGSAAHRFAEARGLRYAFTE